MPGLGAYVKPVLHVIEQNDGVLKARSEIAYIRAAERPFLEEPIT